MKIKLKNSNRHEQKENRIQLMVTAMLSLLLGMCAASTLVLVQAVSESAQADMRSHSVHVSQAIHEVMSGDRTSAKGHLI